MDDQILHNTNDQDFTESFPQSLARLHSCMEQDDAVAALAAANVLQNLFDRLLQMADPNASYQVRSSLTEIHRLLRILHRDLLFWQGAKQTRTKRRTQVLATLQSIQGFYDALEVGWTEAEDMSRNVTDE